MSDLLVVDDNLVLVSVLSEVFKERGYSVRTASDGFAALTAVRERVPDVLISDLNMPRMSGFELLSIVRRRFPSIAVIAMSGGYSGVAVPHGIAADAFYAKGSTSAPHLLEILRAIRDEGTPHFLRAAAPVWIPGIPIGQGGLATVAVACPECLRTFLHCLQHTNFLEAEDSCPHCHQPVQLAIVRPPPDMDETGSGILANTGWISAPADIR
jgi:putative intracellular protease/amidase